VSKGSGTQATAHAHKRSRQEFAMLFNGERRKTVEGFIKQGSYLIEAAEELPYGEYEAMANHTDRRRGSESLTDFWERASREQKA
jgi:hypothetical protein